jgi:hypothetical protein
MSPVLMFRTVMSPLLILVLVLVLVDVDVLTLLLLFVLVLVLVEVLVLLLLLVFVLVTVLVLVDVLFVSTFVVESYVCPTTPVLMMVNKAPIIIVFFMLVLLGLAVNI